MDVSKPSVVRAESPKKYCTAFNHVSQCEAEEFDFRVDVFVLQRTGEVLHKGTASFFKVQGKEVNVEVVTKKQKKNLTQFSFFFMFQD